MVGKITTGKDVYGALLYNQEKVDKKEGKVLATHIIREPEDGLFCARKVAEDLLRWMPTRFRTEKPVIHISLNPDKRDKLTDEELSDIAAKYMVRMGWGSQPYIVFKHTDIDRQHIHIVSVQVDSTGRKISDKKSHERNMKITEELEREYGLYPAKGQKNAELWQLKAVDPAAGNLKKQIGSIVKPAVRMYRFQTMGELKALLSLYNIGVEEVCGEHKGRAYRGLLYGATDDEGNKTAVPLKSSLFGKEVGYDALEKRMQKSGEKIKKEKMADESRRRVALALEISQSEEEFRENLQKQNISLYIRRNDTRITGVTFIDHHTKCVLNGSRIGKAYSANAINEYLTANQNKREKPQETKMIKPDRKGKKL